MEFIDSANNDDAIHGIMIQRPLPKQIDENAVSFRINPDKDIDALHPVNLGKIMLETDGFLPCTPAAVYYTLKYYGIKPSEGKVAILGRSNVVGNRWPICCFGSGKIQMLQLQCVIAVPKT
jgi:methylenetetrahydrofolate dehydrogenase (NADP+)/methenyltetrahydrofolate cyclohydrolase